MSNIDRLFQMEGAEIVSSIIFIFLIFFIAIEVIKGISYLFEKLDYVPKSKKMSDEIDMLKEDVGAFKENRVRDRDQSFQIQKELKTSISGIESQLNTLQDQLKKTDERNRKRIRAEMKDRIAQLYQSYHVKKVWSSMDKETLEDLITEYEEAGGKNSFVHSVVQKEMYTWKLEDEE